MIPIHDFSRDDHESIPFQLIPLSYRSEYDFTKPHRHNYFEIFIFQEGGGKHEIDFQDFKIHDCAIHFVSPGQVHKVRRELDSSGWVILFSRDFFYLGQNETDGLYEMPFFHNDNENCILNLEKTQFQHLRFLIERMENEIGLPNPDQKIIQAYLRAFLLECDRMGGLTWKRVPEADRGDFRRFRALLESHFHQFHQVGDYSKELGLTDKALNELTKSFLGKNTLEVIHNRIELEAKRLLLHTGLSAKEIAYQLQFKDPSHFSKFFKKRTGFSPSEYKNQQSGGA